MVRESRRTVTAYNTARVPGFCKTCNNGWMSQLEKAAAPVLLPMVRGEGRTLDQQEQSLVATWVTKTALVFDQRALGRQPFVSSELTHRFGEDRTPIPGSRVFLASYSGSDWTMNHAVGALPAVYRDGTEKMIVAIITLCLGQLVMQLVCPTDETETTSTSVLARDDAAFAVRIEPRAASVVTWPPPVALGSAEWFEFGLTNQTSVDVGGLLGKVGRRDQQPGG